MERAIYIPFALYILVTLACFSLAIDENKIFLIMSGLMIRNVGGGARISSGLEFYLLTASQLVTVYS